jgi:MerR family redox-sensitive transcriptional activator SoxR
MSAVLGAAPSSHSTLANFAPVAEEEHLPRDRTPTASDWARIASAWRAMLDERIARTTLLRDRLAGCIGCGCLSVTDCPLANPEDIAAERGIGAVGLKP